MTTATAQDRLRQIAILVSSVDATAARQILLHLPTDKARRVRELATQLGTVSAEEKRKILAEFQRSATTTSAASQSNASSGSRSAAHNRYAADVDELAAQSADLPDYAQPGRTNNSAKTYSTGVHPLRASGGAEGDWNDERSTTAHSAADSWTHLSPAALVRFVRSERPAVTAVVISQLAPHVAVEVLQHLPPATSRDVLVRLSRLRDIDPEAMSAIDEHLSRRLNEYQHSIASELENSRRMQSLLAAAPIEIREQWSSILTADSEQLSEVNHTAAQPTQQSTTDSQGVEQPRNVQPVEVAHPQDIFDISNNVFSTVDTNANVVGSLNNRTSSAAPESEGFRQPAGPTDILPFPQGATGHNTTDDVDRSLNQIEFEQILHLPPWLLAKLLSQTDSQFVLLALAGATPQFMKRFLNMLDRQDAKTLQSRLQRIGPIRLRDIDEAQRRIVENAARLTKQEQPRKAVA